MTFRGGLGDHFIFRRGAGGVQVPGVIRSSSMRWRSLSSQDTADCLDGKVSAGRCITPWWR